jgi:hypothetical protein
MFNNARGSLLIAVLYHFQMMNPLWPDAQPWDILLFVAAALIVVWLNRRTMFQRDSGVTNILMPIQEIEVNSGMGRGSPAHLLSVITRRRMSA